MPDTESAQAWRELLTAFADLDQNFHAGPKAVRGETAVAEGYRNLATILGVALDMNLFADPVAPRFIDNLTPTRPDRRWGGDNTDCYYSYAVVDPRRTYRVSGTPADSAMYSVTVYNEPEPGAWPNKTVGLLYDTDMPVDGDGRFSCLLGPRRPDGYHGPFIELSPDAHGVLTRDYHRFPADEARVDWQIEVVDHAGLDVTPDHSDAGVARSLRAALRFAQDVYALTPLTLAGQNFLAPPYRAGDATHGYSMADACYCLGGFNLEPGQAAVITVRHPRSRFWNFTLWNQYMAALDVEYGRGGINIGTAVPNSDGTVTIVIARDQLEHPNALSTKDHAEGLMSFRWFHADELPEAPTLDIVAIADAPRAVT